MKRFLASLAAAGLAACGESPTVDGPSLELTDPGLRLRSVVINSHVYGSFRIAAPGGPAVILGGMANFPGHPPAGPGTCLNGLWINPQGKATAGTLSKPHPHCVSSSSAVEIVLEPISACYSGFSGAECKAEPPTGGSAVGLTLSEEGDGTGVDVTTYGDAAHTTRTDGYGIVVGYAIDAATLGTTNRRVGVITVDLVQYTAFGINYFDSGAGGCDMDVTILAPCLNLVITAAYAPLPSPDGVGSAQTVTGFLWIAPASAPYNYLP